MPDLRHWEYAQACQSGKDITLMPQTTLSHTFSPAHITALNQTLKSPQNADHLTRLLKCHKLLLRWQQDGNDTTLGKLWRAYCRADVEDF